MKSVVNGVEVEMTPEQVAAFNQDLAVTAAGFALLPVESVSSRQFKLQLLAEGLIDAVDAWVAQQPRDVQIAYEYSGTFVKDSPMMTAGFTAMGFTPPEIDAFFRAAAAL